MDCMGLRDRLRRTDGHSEAPNQVGQGAPFSGEKQLAGTTTVAKVEVANLIQRHGLPERGMLDTVVALRREPDNPVDPAAVAAYADGIRVGYLSSAVARHLPLHPSAELRVPMRLFSLKLDQGHRGEAWVWLGSGSPLWSYSVTNPPPLTPAEKRAAEAAFHANLVHEGLAEGGRRAEQFRAGMVNGVHYLELVEPIKQLKREGRLRGALALCYQAIEGAEKAAEGLEPAPAYTEHVAIIHRKLGEHDLEMAGAYTYFGVGRNGILYPCHVLAGSGVAEDGLHTRESDGVPRGEVSLQSSAEVVFDESLAVLRGQPFSERTRRHPHRRFRPGTMFLAFRVGFRMVRKVGSQRFDQRKRVRISVQYLH